LPVEIVKAVFLISGIRGGELKTSTGGTRREGEKRGAEGRAKEKIEK